MNLVLSKILLVVLSVLLLFGYAASVGAREAHCADSDESCAEVGEWSLSVALGAGLRENPVVGQDDIPLIVIPTLSYYGKRFSLENYNLAYLLADSKHQELSAIATLSFEYMFFRDLSLGSIVLEGGRMGNAVSRSPTAEDSPRFEPEADEIDVAPQPVIELDDLHDRNLAVLSGLDYSLYLQNTHFGLQALADVSGAHKGTEIRAALSQDLSLSSHHVRVSLGALWKSDRVMDYYYGVRENEVPNSSFIYEAESDVSYFARISWNKKINDKWSLVSSLYHRRLSDEAFNSPLIDKRAISTFFVGGRYHF